MSTLNITKEPRAKAVRVGRVTLVIFLEDGRRLSVPLSWFPKLIQASEKKRNHVQIICRGTGLHWPDVDEDISVVKLVTGGCE